MRRESLRGFLLDSYYFGWLVEIRFTALIAPHLERDSEMRERSKSIRHSKTDFMSKEEILSEVIPVVLAKNCPTIICIFPHTRVLKKRIGRGGCANRSRF